MAIFQGAQFWSIRQALTFTVTYPLQLPYSKGVLPSVYPIDAFVRRCKNHDMRLTLSVKALFDPEELAAAIETEGAAMVEKENA